MPAFYPTDRSMHLPYPSSGSVPGNSPAKWTANGFGSHYSAYPSTEDQKLLAMLSQQNGLRHEPPLPFYQPSNYTPISALPPPVGAPMMAAAPMDLRYRHAPPTYEDRQPRYRTYEPEPKEEKTTGGVSSKLDYNMEQMTDFICAMTVKILNFSQKPQPEFRKWVLQVLHATRLPSATLLISLTYLSQRYRQLSSQRQMSCNERDLYLYLIIGLILGSKFLDDNTFQNKSWAEVSNLSVQELGQAEREWLIAFNHRLHIDPEADDGFAMWQQQWNNFRARPAFVPQPLRIIDSNSQRQSPLRGGQLRNHPSAQSFKSQFDETSFDGWDERQTRSLATYGPWLNNTSDRSPSSVSHTGPSTPDYYGGPLGWDAPRGFGPASNPLCGPTLSYPADISLFENFGSSSLNYGSSLDWNCHGASCHCNTCRQPSRHAPVVVSS